MHRVHLVAGEAWPWPCKPVLGGFEVVGVRERQSRSQVHTVNIGTLLVGLMMLVTYRYSSTQKRNGTCILRVLSWLSAFVL